MSTVKNVNINGTVSKLSAGVYDVSEQNNGKHYSGISDVLSQANTDILTNDRFSGMQIKFIQTTPAKYTVVKTEGVVEQPAGTEIQSDRGVDSGTYEESQLNVAFSSLPATLNSSITYYLTVTETTTYTTWKITLVQSSDNNYVQYRLMSTAWSNDVSDWQGVDDGPVFGSENLVQSGGVAAALDGMFGNTNDADFAISDKNRNDIARFKNGHIVTKNFDSSVNATSEQRGLMSASDKGKLDDIEEGAQANDVITSSADTCDLEIADENGHELVRFKDGHIKTKNFDSSKSTSYKEQTFYPSWIGGNAIKQVSVGSGFQFDNDETNAVSFIHSKLFNVASGTTVSFGCDISTVDMSAFFLSADYKIVAIEDVHASGNSWSSVHITVPDNGEMMILQAAATDGSNNVLPSINLSVSCMLDVCSPTSFFPRNSDSGYQHLTIKISLTDFQSNSYTPNNALQVESLYYVDHGVLCLPATYTSNGEPTRLICFTHGHAVNYDDSSKRFDSKDIKPAYWLSEGYAIFDMDGSVTGTFDGNYEYEPAFVNAYDSAYQWIVRHFNIRTDGVFATGRSMGGGTQFVLAKRSVMPILASAPMVAFASPLSYLGVNNSDALKALLAAYGVPQSALDAVTTWADVYYYQQSNEVKQLIYDNQWRWCQYAPGWMFNRPLTIEELSMWDEGFRDRDETLLENFFDSVKDSINVSLYRNIPFRMYTCVGDGSVWYKTVELCHKMIVHGGGFAQIHVFPSLENPTTSISNHRFEISNENLVTYTNSRGITIENVPKVYIEILSFWRRFENQDYNYSN